MRRAACGSTCRTPTGRGGTRTAASRARSKTPSSGTSTTPACRRRSETERGCRPRSSRRPRYGRELDDPSQAGGPLEIAGSSAYMISACALRAGRAARTGRPPDLREAAEADVRGDGEHSKRPTAVAEEASEADALAPAVGRLRANPSSPPWSRGAAVESLEARASDPVSVGAESGAAVSRSGALPPCRRATKRHRLPSFACAVEGPVSERDAAAPGAERIWAQSSTESLGSAGGTASPGALSGDECRRGREQVNHAHAPTPAGHRTNPVANGSGVALRALELALAQRLAAGVARSGAGWTRCVEQILQAGSVDPQQLVIESWDQRPQRVEQVVGPALGCAAQARHSPGLDRLRLR